MIATLIGAWSGIGAFVIAGPAALNVKENGPFCKRALPPSGQTDRSLPPSRSLWLLVLDFQPIPNCAYRVSSFPRDLMRFSNALVLSLDYMFVSSDPRDNSIRPELDSTKMFASAFLASILYTLIFFRLRGNIVVNGPRVRFRMRSESDSLNGISADTQTMKVAKQMLLWAILIGCLVYSFTNTYVSQLSRTPMKSHLILDFDLDEKISRWHTRWLSHLSLSVASRTGPVTKCRLLPWYSGVLVPSSDDMEVTLLASSDTVYLMSGLLTSASLR